MSVLDFVDYAQNSSEAIYESIRKITSDLFEKWQYSSSEAQQDIKEQA